MVVPPNPEREAEYTLKWAPGSLAPREYFLRDDVLAGPEMIALFWNLYLSKSSVLQHSRSLYYIEIKALRDLVVQNDSKACPVARKTASDNEKAGMRCKGQKCSGRNPSRQVGSA